MNPIQERDAAQRLYAQGDHLCPLDWASYLAHSREPEEVKELAQTLYDRIPSSVAAKSDDEAFEQLMGDIPMLLKIAAEASLEPLQSEMGRYHRLQPLAQGGFGQTYLSIDHNAKYVVKVIPNLGDRDQHSFDHEVSLSRKFNHPNIVRYRDHGLTDENSFFLVTDYVEDARHLDTYCDQERLTLNKRLELFLECCEGVSFLHRNLLAHRDLKPANIMVDSSGKPVLLDFGISQLLPRDDRMTAGSVKRHAKNWTLQFASPEQYQGGKISNASDIYALGVILYQLLCGIMPYRIKRTDSVARARNLICSIIPDSMTHRVSSIIACKPGHGSTSDLAHICHLRGTKPLALRQQLDDGLSAVVDKMLRKDPQHRYRSIEELCADLKAYLSGRPVTVRSDKGYRIRKFLARNKMRLASACLVTCLLLLGTWTLRQSHGRVKAATDEAVVTRNWMLNLFATASPDLLPGARREIVDLLDAGNRQTHQNRNIKKILAQAYESVDEFAKSAAVYQRLFDEAPLDVYAQPWAHTLLFAGLENLKQGDWFEGERQLKQRHILRRAFQAPAHPEDLIALLAQLHIAQYCGDRKQVNALVAACLHQLSHLEAEQDLLTPLLYDSLLNVFAADNQPAEVLTFLQGNLELFEGTPASSWFWARMAWIAMEAGAPKQATLTFQGAIARFPDEATQPLFKYLKKARYLSLIAEEGYVGLATEGEAFQQNMQLPAPSTHQILTATFQPAVLKVASRNTWWDALGLVKQIEYEVLADHWWLKPHEILTFFKGETPAPVTAKPAKLPIALQRLWRLAQAQAFEKQGRTKEAHRELIQLAKELERSNGHILPEGYLCQAALAAHYLGREEVWNARLATTRAIGIYSALNQSQRNALLAVGTGGGTVHGMVIKGMFGAPGNRSPSILNAITHPESAVAAVPEQLARILYSPNRSASFQTLSQFSFGSAEGQGIDFMTRFMERTFEDPDLQDWFIEQVQNYTQNGTLPTTFFQGPMYAKLGTLFMELASELGNPMESFVESSHPLAQPMKAFLLEKRKEVQATIQQAPFSADALPLLFASITGGKHQADYEARVEAFKERWLQLSKEMPPQLPELKEGPEQVRIHQELARGMADVYQEAEKDQPPLASWIERGLEILTKKELTEQEP